LTLFYNGLMKIPTPTINYTLIQSLASYETARKMVLAVDVPLSYLRKVESQAVLKSSLYSARIEGNKLSESSFENSKNEQAKQEVFNLIDAIEYIKHIPIRSPITPKTIRELHAKVLNGLSADAGNLRTQQNAIFDQFGGVRYLPPPPITMRKDLDTLLAYCNEPAEFPILTALIAHLVFEKIHPFIDGNGRVGRLLVTLTLNAQGQTFPFIIPFDHYLESHRDLYYRYIDIGTKDIGGYLLFMLEALTNELTALHAELTHKQISTGHYLSPRREEIVNIIKDHPYITMDGIHRRFLGVPIRTLRYDIAQLVNSGHVQKVGTTKGSCYIKGREN